MMTPRIEARRTIAGQSGFTVLELMLSLTLVAVVGGIASPSFTQIRNHYQLDGASRQLAMEISKARMQAVAQNRTIRVRLNSGHSYVFESSENGTTFSQVGESIALPGGVYVTSGETGTPRFNRQGLAPTSTTISVIGAAGVKTIQTTVLGRVTRS